MANPEINIIAAVSENGVIGKDGQIPWHISEDLRRFKELTTGHVVVMGRKTFESIGRALPNRVNIVVTRDHNFNAEGCIVCHSFEDAIRVAKESDDRIFIMGGGQVYEEGMQIADNLYLTIVEGEFEGDTFFPDYEDFRIVSEEEGQEGNLKYKFLNLER